GCGPPPPGAGDHQGVRAAWPLSGERSLRAFGPCRGEQRMNLLKAAHRNTRSWARETFQKTGVRQWLLATLVFVILGSMLLSNAVTERFDLSAGQVAPRDIEAPQRVVNRYRTELERSAHADRAVAEAVERDENYVVNQAVAVRAKESVAAFFGELIRALPTDGTGGAEAGREPAMRSEAVALRVLEITS